MKMSNELSRLYARRIENINIDDVKVLEELAITDMKSVQFVAWYYYLTRHVISESVINSPIMLSVISNLVKSTDNSNVAEYFDKYFDTEEVFSQFKKIIDEERILTKRKYILSHNNHNKENV